MTICSLKGADSKLITNNHATISHSLSSCCKLGFSYKGCYISIQWGNICGMSHVLCTRCRHQSPCNSGSPYWKLCRMVRNFSARRNLAHEGDNAPCFQSQPSLSGLKKVCIRSLPSSSGILKGSFLMLSYRL